MIIRAAQTTDAEAAAELSTQLGYPCSETEVKKRIIDLSAQKDNTLFICEVDGVVVGWIQVAVERFIGSAPFAEVCGLVIAEQQRGRGCRSNAAGIRRGVGIRPGIRYHLCQQQYHPGKGTSFLPAERLSNKEKPVCILQRALMQSDFF